ncbi:RNA-directed DNA polymerase, eukaryota, reverse transcriptase zinc-binding domain protein [Tanacetum coccineum]
MEGSSHGEIEENERALNQVNCDEHVSDREEAEVEEESIAKNATVFEKHDNCDDQVVNDNKGSKNMSDGKEDDGYDRENGVVNDGSDCNKNVGGVKIVGSSYRIDDNGVEVVVFDEAMVEEGSKRWEKTLCAYFVGYGISVNELRYNLRRMWSRCGFKDIVDSNNGIFFIKFNNEEEVIPLWIKLCNIPLEAWTTKGISALASRVGKQVVMDVVTVSMCKMGVGRVGFARVLAEVSARKPLPYDIEVVYKNGAKEVICRKNVKVVYDWKPPCCNKCCVFGHFSHQCGKNKVATRKEESVKNAGVEKRKEDIPKQSGSNEKSDNDGFIFVQNKRSIGMNEKVLRPNYKPNTQQSKFQPRKVNTHYEFQPKKNVSNANTTKEPLAPFEQVKNSDKGAQMQSTPNVQVKNNDKGVQKLVDKTPQKKAWSVHGEILSAAMKRSANKYFILDLYDETEIIELQEMKNREIVEGFIQQKKIPTENVMRGWNKDMVNYYKQRRSFMNEAGVGKEFDDVLNDESGIVECMENDGVNGLSTSDKQREVRNFLADEELSVHAVNGFNSIFCTFVYAANGGKERKELWKDLYIHKRIVGSNAWVIMGDLNVTLNPNEHSAGSSSMTSDMNDFKDCINSIEVEDLTSSGLFFTWTKNLFKAKAGDSTGVLKKLDRIMGNEECIDKYPQSHVVFIPYLISDHSPYVIIIPKVIKTKRKAIKFANFIADKKEFISIITMKDEEKLMYQKAKIKWISFGDRNNDFFHKVLKSQKNKCRINSVRDSKGNLFHGNEVADQFVKHFKSFLEKLLMLMIEAMFQIDSNKAPSPDGFSSHCFKRAWEIVGTNVCKAIKEFFITRKMLKEINSTLISLIPKIQTPDKVIDFRIIACCNSAFVTNMHIQDDILLSQELLKGYERKEGRKRVAMKVDIQKAYDTINWKFLEAILVENYGYFKGGRGLRQGDPMSPCLFTLMKLTHVCFADDLLLFCHGNKNSVIVLKKAIEEFGDISGLLPNYSKNTIIFGSMKMEDQQEILKCVPFKVEKLPSFITNRHLYIARRNTNMVVKDIVEDGNCKCPEEWIVKYLILTLHQRIQLDLEKEDNIIWRYKDGNERKFTNIPNHSFILCHDMDSHQHLFFQCKFAKDHWSKVKDKMGVVNDEKN